MDETEAEYQVRTRERGPGPTHAHTPTHTPLVEVVHLVPAQGPESLALQHHGVEKHKTCANTHTPRQAAARDRLAQGPELASRVCSEVCMQPSVSMRNRRKHCELVTRVARHALYSSLRKTTGLEVAERESSVDWK